jgi:hypothetical protein
MNGTVTSFDLGIASEDFTLIPTNSLVETNILYCTSTYGGKDSNGQVFKLSKTLLTSYAGDLLILQGEPLNGGVKLFIVHWDGANLIMRRISCNDPYELESARFAPIDIPGI